MDFSVHVSNFILQSTVVFYYVKYRLGQTARKPRKVFILGDVPYQCAVLCAAVSSSNSIADLSIVPDAGKAPHLCSCFYNFICGSTCCNGHCGNEPKHRGAVYYFRGWHFFARSRKLYQLFNFGVVCADYCAVLFHQAACGATQYAGGFAFFTGHGAGHGGGAVLVP